MHKTLANIFSSEIRHEILHLSDKRIRNFGDWDTFVTEWVQLYEQSRPIDKERITQAIDSLFHATYQHTRANFSEYLNFHGINPVFRENKDGVIYGVTFIDNRKGAVINGSDLGKKYSGQALVKQFNHRAAGERERQERVERGLEWPQYEIYDPSAANWMHDITQEFLNLMKAETHYPEPSNHYLKRRKKRKRGIHYRPHRYLVNQL